MITAVHLGMAAQTIGKYRTTRLIVKCREIAMAL
jgi:hypothetical protein